MMHLPGSTHAVQLFDDDLSRANALSGFIRQGLEDGDHVLLVATAPHWEAARTHLERRPVPVGEALSRGQLIVVDACQLLDRFMRNGRVNQQLFNTIVGSTVRRLRQSARRLRAYGEMVDVLALQGEFKQALQLEAAWNELLQTETIHLLCGYSAASFGHPGSRDALADVCRVHGHLRFRPHDSLSAFLVPAEPRTGGLYQTH